MNVVPDSCEITGTLRYVDDAEPTWRAIEETCRRVALEYEVSIQVTPTPGTPAVMNDPAMAMRLCSVLADQPGLRLRWLPTTLPTSDNAAELLNRRPGVYLLLGAALDDPLTRRAHTPSFRMDRDVLDIGLHVLTVSVSDLLLHRTSCN